MSFERFLRLALVAIAITGLSAGILAFLAGRTDLADLCWTVATAPVVAGLAVSIIRDLLTGRFGVDAIALVSMVDGPARALALIEALEARGGLNGYELMPAVRADLLRRLGRRDAAREAYLAATAATQLEPLRRLYARRLAELDCE